MYRPSIYHNNTRFGKRYPTTHVVYTEAQSLEEACEVISGQRYQAKRVATAQQSSPSLKQELARVIGLSFLLKKTGKISLANGTTSANVVSRKRRLPHPLRDLSTEQKCAKAREMFGSGTWGTGITGTKRLAVAFCVPVEQMSLWLERVTAPL